MLARQKEKPNNNNKKTIPRQPEQHDKHTNRDQNQQKCTILRALQGSGREVLV
jgi:hypothetical protein